MFKKASSYFNTKTLAHSLCLICFAGASVSLDAKVNPRLDEKVHYTMNFRNINIVEYIRFVSKISKINFIFNEQELNFPVTLVSDQPVSAKNLFSALAQVLEVNGFSLSDQEGSILITRNPGSSQLAAINELSSAMSTRIYKIDNINLVTLTQIIKSIVSKGALVESVLDTHQLIVTDTTPNLEKLAQLINDLDSAGSNLKILSYKVKNQSPKALADHLKAVIAPFQGGNPYLVVPQMTNNQILVVSTPYLIKQTQDALMALDIPDAMMPIGTDAENVYLYMPKFRKTSEIKYSLMMLANSLLSEGPTASSLISMIHSMKTPDGSTGLLFVGSQGVWTKLQELLSSIDNKDSMSTVFIYTIQSTSPKTLESLLEETASKMEEVGDPDGIVETIDSMSYNASTNSLTFTGIPASILKLKEILATLDKPTDLSSESSYFIYELRNVQGDYILEELKQLEPTFSKGESQNLIQAINTIKWLKNNNSLLLFGSKKTLASLEGLIAKLDVPSSAKASNLKSGFVVYPLKGSNGQAIADQLHSMAEEITVSSTQSSANQEALRRVKYVPETNSMMIFGNGESIDFIEKIIEKIDTNAPSATYAFYQVKGQNGKMIVDKLHKLAKNLPDDSASEQAVVNSLKSARYIEETNTILIQGTPASIAFVQSMALQLNEGALISKDTGFIVVSLKNTSSDAVVMQLHEMALHITDTSLPSEAIRETLSSARSMDDTNSVMLTGSKDAVSFAQGLVEKMDSSPAGTATTFYLYKLQSKQGDKVIRQVQSFADKLPSSSASDRNVINAIKQLQWIEDNNSILISGNQQTIDRVSLLIAQYDSGAPATADNKGDFLIYSPKFLSLDVLEEAVQEYAVALKQSGLSDPNLIETITTAQVVPSANHLVFTGNADSIMKVKTILSFVDTESPQSAFHKLGQMTFYVHQLKSLTPDQFSSAIRSFEAGLSKSNASDMAVARSIEGMQYIKETNAFLFTGTQAVLDKVAQIADKLDVGKGSQELTYEIYTPRYLDGNALIEQMCQFAQGISDSGVKDQSLYDTINNIKWIEKSNSMIISGPAESIAKVQDLLVKFDVPGAGKPGTGTSSSGFMVYKLQYHKGTDIVSALNKLAPTFESGGPNANPGLAASINSIQWIQATNSLVASGDQDNLEKLNILIKEIDMPLKQVFIEVLVIETDSSNTQNFGLQWFGKGNIKNQLGFGTGNMGGPNPFTQSQSSPNFGSVASNTGVTFPTTSTPLVSGIPFYGNTSSGNGPSGPGFDLGVIGDILFHKGKSFTSLGSLVNALQADYDTTIVMNPKIISQDSQNSTIFIGQNIPFVGSSVTNTSNNTVTSANLEYRDVGTSLSITPKLGDDNVVTLEITYNMSSVNTNNFNGSSGGPNGMQTFQTNMTTRVHVPDQHFVVLSGMLRDAKSYQKTGIPCLGGLPVIGLAFSETDRENAKSNILIFIRPCIIHNLDELKEITDKQENKYRDVLNRQVDKEDFDQGLNYVKESADE